MKLLLLTAIVVTLFVANCQGLRVTIADLYIYFFVQHFTVKTYNLDFSGAMFPSFCSINLHRAMQNCPIIFPNPILTVIKKVHE